MLVLKWFLVGAIATSSLFIPLVTSQASEKPEILSLSYKVSSEDSQMKSVPLYLAAMTSMENNRRIAAEIEAQRIAAEAEAQRVAAEQQRYAEATEAAEQPEYQSSSSAPAVSGSCAESAPAGFPDYIVQRESGGDPNAYNSSSGARGCAQILDSHFDSGGSCAGLGYSECWSKLWADGAGASHWACTPESGCG